MTYQITDNLQGDRDFEYAYTIRKIPRGTGYALDIGSGGIGLVAVALRDNGYITHALDITPAPVPHNVHPIIADIRDYHPTTRYAVITAVSTLEHVGIAGRYDVTNLSPDGDLDAMANVRSLLADDGHFILTLPVGVDTVHYPLHRVYGVNRLARLLDGFTVVNETYRIKRGGVWHEATKQEALARYSVKVSDTWQGCTYGLMGAVLRK